ncbi:patatin-like phospholipase family protein [Streptomyces sp. NBC_01353]|uniref:patatin-like phospholipase family protein n=1 Tax=Streptomyces sp. NBC_01353 TaxID=2903835 RepID=UPI002E2FD21C|nr:patatin-like phospholipase family protein [Streptomyces sp. NBC_01353]
MTRTALVLGSGGMTGAGWATGVLHGLAEAGTDLSTADLIIGSSAGAVVGTQLASGKITVAELYESRLDDGQGEPAGRLGAGTILHYAIAVLTSRTAEAYGRKLGALALGATTVDEATRRDTVARRLAPVAQWPERRLLVTAVDALTGELRAYDRDSGAALLDAVTASCAIPGLWPPATIDGRRWIDGGVHSTANAHLAVGYDRVVVIAPNGSGSKVIVSPARQGAALASAGARVEVITPDADSKAAFGRNPLDPSRRGPAARAGRAQAAAHAEAARALWAQ